MTDIVAQLSQLPAQPAESKRRRYLTMLFSDLVGSTTLAQSMEAESYAEILHAIREVYQSVIPKLGGTVVRIQGDGLLAIFGYPKAQEDDGRRAAEAALQMHDLVRRLRFSTAFGQPISLRLHTGAHSGLVLLDEGDVVLGRFELLGDAPNIAAKLSKAAASDEILISEETLGPEAHYFQTGKLRRYEIEGARCGLPAFSVTARESVETRLAARAQRGLALFVGRAAELRSLEAVLRQAMEGVPRFFAISAGPGLGKSRLADEFARRASNLGCQVHRGYCESQLAAEPLQAVLQILRQLFSLRPSMSASVGAAAVDRILRELNVARGGRRDELLRALSLSKTEDKSNVGSSPAPLNLIRIVRDIFDRLTTRRPQVVVIDDLQWADDATLKILEALRGLKGRPILVLVATRGFAAGDADMFSAGILELSPLSDAEAARVIDRLLPGINPFLTARIYRYAGGNPLYIEELCHSQRIVDSDRGLDRAPEGTAWLSTLIESRVARLPDDQADLVRVAAVIGNVIPLWLLEELTACELGWPLIRRLADQDFIFPGDQTGTLSIKPDDRPETLRFKHAITRDVIYSSVGLRDRMALHLRVARTLEERRSGGLLEDSYEFLAYHFGAAGQPRMAARYAELAGDKAMATSAFDRAQTQYRAALAALDQMETSEAIGQQWLSIAQRLGFACVFDPAREHLEVFRRAVTFAAERKDDFATAQSQYWLGYINYALGESGVARHHCEQALSAARASGRESLVAQVSATLGQVRAASSDYEGALQLLDEALSAKRKDRVAGRLAVGSVYSLACKGSVLGDLGRFSEAHRCFDEALEELGDARHGVEGSVRCWRAGVFLWQGKWDEARRDADLAEAIGERVTSLYVFAMGRSLGAYARWVMDRDGPALQRLLDATSWLEARDKRLFISLNYGWLADAMEAAGRPAEARRFAARAILRGHRQDRLGEVMAYRALARLALDSRAARSAEHYLERGLLAARARSSSHEVSVTQMHVAELRALRGDREGARAMLDELVSVFEELQMDWHRAEARRRLQGL